MIVTHFFHLHEFHHTYVILLHYSMVYNRFFQENEPIPHASFNEKQMFILSFLDWLLYNKHEIDSYINERIFTKEEDHVSTICTDIFSLSRNPFSNHRLLSKCFCPFKYSRNC